jgi:3-hydroxyacyl-[acyl-carrier-protein] dehydratase
MNLPLGYEEIVKILPHRYPFLLVDRVTELEPGKRVKGIKNVTANEPFFQGHFPGHPIMPEDVKKKGPRDFYFVSMDKVKFRRPVVPGDQLVFELVTLRTGSRVWKMAGKAFVNEELVAEAELIATIA